MSWCPSRIRLQCSIHQLCFVQKLISHQSLWERQICTDPHIPYRQLFSGAAVGFVCASQSFQGMNSSSKALVLDCSRPSVSVLLQLWCAREADWNRSVTWGHYCSQILVSRVICIWKFIAVEYISGKAALYQKISSSSTTGYNFKWSVPLSGKTTAKLIIKKLNFLD